MTHLTKIYQHHFQQTLALSALALAIPWQAGLAATFEVDRIDDSPGATTCTTAANDCSLRGAISTSNATPGSNIINLPAGTYTLSDVSGILNLTVNLTLNGAGSSSTIIQAATGWNYQMFNIPAATVNINNVTIQNANNQCGGSCYGGAIYSNGPLTVDNVKFLNNKSVLALSGYGASIFIFTGGTATITNSLFDGNISNDNGGALFSHGPLTISNTTFSNNQSARYGGAVFANGANTTLTNVQFLNNTVNLLTGVSGGGGICATGTLTINNSTFQGNQAVIQGGGIYSNSLTLNQSQLLNNMVTNAGGQGGGVFLNGNLTVTNSTIDGNSAAGGCGGVRVGGVLTATNTIISNNQSNATGGGGCVASVTLTNTQILNNQAVTVGGGLDISGSSTLQNVLFANNTVSTGNGAAMYIQAGPTNIYHTTLSSQTPNPKDAIYVTNLVTVTVKNTIITNHAIGILNVGGTPVVTEDYNLFFGNTTNLGGPITSGGNSLTGDPLFFNPAANDYHLMVGSAAIDKGVSGLGVTTDFEGEARPYGSAPDIGYDEAIGYNLTLATDGTGTGTVSSSGTYTGTSCGAGCLTYLSFTTVTLTATATNGSSFAGWNCTPAFTSGNPLTAHTTCTATFNLGAPVPVTPGTLPLPDQLGLFLQPDGTGQGKVSTDTGLSCHRSDCQKAADGTLTCNPQTCSQIVKTGTAVALTPLPDTGSIFSSWGGNEDCVDGQLLMDGGKLCIAYFHLIDEPLTVVIAGQGTVTATKLNCSSTCVVYYPYGSAVTLQTQPAAGWQFQAFSGDCDSNGQVLLIDTKNCGVTFMPNPATFDEDLDQVPSAIEEAAPNQGDGNGDGIPDTQQNNVASFTDAVGGLYLTLQTDPNCPITNVYGELPDKYPGHNPNHHLPQGLTYFELSCVQTQVSLYSHAMTAVRRNLIFQKFGPQVPGNEQTVGWYRFPNVTFEAVMIGGKSVVKATYLLKDGELGDSTGVDGRIVDPGGMVVE